jgi:hypothetical protein
MPQFRKLSNDEVTALSTRRVREDVLVPYLSNLSSLRPGDWGSIELEDGDTQRAVKRRTTVAARTQGKDIRWRRSPSPQRLVFEVRDRG